ncbi:hypothetical protein K438DRAFT_1981079 [Mycena galopus ATCC 62051]|nr:hypothetical protein K438DRAFT_1981079 [Mycena galopus ATCC 62051]
MSCLQNMTNQICILKRDLTRKSSQRFAEDDLESHWTTRCSVEEREDLILEGLVRACEASLDFEDRRKWLKLLNHESGQDFIHLLKQLSLPDFDKVPDDIKTLPNVVYDKVNGFPANAHPGLVVTRKSCDCGRTYLLTMVVWNVLLAFYGESKKREDRDEYKYLKESLSSEVDVKSVMRETAANRQRAEPYCTSCGLPASKAGIATLSACQRCKAIDRLLEITDWNTPRPPHKTICGKSDDDDDDDYFGEPNPAILWPRSIQNPLGRMFLVCDCSPREVFKMFQQLEQSARNAPGFSVAQLKKQMLKEYGIDVDVAKAEYFPAWRNTLCLFNGLYDFLRLLSRHLGSETGFSSPVL